MRINDTYDISIDGEVKNMKTGRILKTHLSGYGYKTLRLGQGKHYYIHHLVANAFLPQPTDDECQIDHIDRDRMNNHASNLRWVSKSVNQSNKPIAMKARANKKSEHHHIYDNMTKGQKTLTYRVVINSKTLKHYSIHKTLEEAIQKRDEILG